MDLKCVDTNLTPRRGQRTKKKSLKAIESKENLSLFDNETTTCYYDDSSSLEEICDSSESSSTDVESEENEEESEVSESDISPHQSTRKCLSKAKMQNPKQKLKNVSNVKSYVIKSEDYFSNNSSKKNKTSNHTLDNLNKPRLSQEELKTLLSSITLSENHKEVIAEMCVQNKNNFEKWICLLHEGFNVLLYGLGSKRDILHQFHQKYLKNSPVIIVNGFFPSLTMKDILDSIICEILEIKECPANIFEASDIISNEFAVLANLHLYIIIHNIEGEMLRANPKNQSVLAKLSDVKNIHLIASIDHINAPLIWDHSKLSKFNFTWWDVTSFLPYVEETSFETSMMVNKTGSLALSSLRNVFLSLTSNSKGIYLIIVKYQLQNTNQYYQGMLFKDLYSTCREAFLVSSDLALRAQLTEFVDHKMVKFRRSTDGAEYLLIPINNSLLQQFLNDQ